MWECMPIGGLFSNPTLFYHSPSAPFTIGHCYPENVKRCPVVPPTELSFTGWTDSMSLAEHCVQAFL
jgi:hypothetical protein